jgi:hypothetical protein
VTVPLPLPDPPAVTLSHGTLLKLAHEHPLDVVTLTVPVPPDEGVDCSVGEIE